MPILVNRCDFGINQLIDDKYQVTKILGEGAFGKVYKVQKPGNLTTTYALKLLKLWEVQENIRQGLIDRFDMEFATGQIQSSYLVHSLDHGIIYGNPYIVMEFCPCGDLSQFINESNKTHQQIPDLNMYALHMLSGLTDLHRSGKVHRDLKPENVLLKTKQWAALTDFGICGDRNKRMTERNIIGKPMQMFGTYAYMPPEQAQRLKGDATVLPTTDIFSFGVMLYQLIVGTLPFGPLNDHNELVEYQKNALKGIWNRNHLRDCCTTFNWEPIIEACLIPDYKSRIQKTTDIIKMLPNSENVQVSECFRSTGINLLLRVMQGEEYGKTYLLNELIKEGKSFLTLGRECDNRVVIQELCSCYISRYHCTLEYEAYSNRWFIRDGQWRQKNSNATQGGSWIQSTNGTFVNSSEVPANGLEIKSGDIISIGEVKLRAENY